jgi:F-type H+-transporting ATPase subunit delta
MSSASREAYAAAADQLTASAGTATAAQLATTADDILSVAAVLRSQPRLRRALIDPSRSGDDRAGLLSSLLSGKVSAQALEVLSTLVAGRWSTPNELLNATERLGIDALLDSGAKEDKLSEVEDELFRFGQIVSGNSQLAVTLSDPGASTERRVKLIDDLLKGKAQPVTVRLLEVAIEGYGGRSFESSLSRLVEATAAKRDRQVAYVTVAKALTDSEEDRLSAKLTEIYGHQISLKVDVDPSIIGGISVQVGSDLYDGTILRRLNEARQAFAK